MGGRLGSESVAGLRRNTQADVVGREVRCFFDALIANPRIAPVSAIRQMSRAQKLAKEYGYERVVSACARANQVGAQTIDSLDSILKREIDLRPLESSNQHAAKPVVHKNVRGAAAYSGEK